MICINSLLRTAVSSSLGAWILVPVLALILGFGLGACSRGAVGGLAADRSADVDGNGDSEGAPSDDDSNSAGDTGGDSGGGDAGPLPQIDASACATPIQDSVDTSSWREIFVGTSADSCSDSAADAGSASTPYCNPHLALSKVTAASTIVTFYDGQYRLADFERVNGGRGALSLPNWASTADSFLIYRAAAGASPVFLGSVRRRGGWTLHSTSPRIYRLSVEDLVNDVRGLWQVQDGLERTYTQARRFRHIMVSASGGRAHAAVADLAEGGSGYPETSMTESKATRNATWTKADAAGAPCTTSNAGCYLYLRLDDASVDPNTLVFEVPQYNILGGGSSYMVLDGLHGRFSQSASGGQNSSAWFEGRDDVLVQHCSFGHIANSDENAYAFALWFTNGSIVRHNRFFDSAYWGGTPNSKGLTFMCSGQVAPNWVCGNEIYHIPGNAGVGAKGGVANLMVVGNYLHDNHCSVETTHDRLQDGVDYQGGNWTIKQNIIERSTRGVCLSRNSHIATELPDVVLNNLFLDNFHAVALAWHSTPASGIHNNIFLGGNLANSCDGYGTCGAGVYFSNNSGTLREYSYILGELAIQMSHNDYHGLTYSHGINRNWTPDFVNYTLSEFITAWASYAPEQGSLAVDPQLDPDHAYRPAPTSPVVGAGDGSFYGKASVNMGLYP